MPILNTSRSAGPRAIGDPQSQRDGRVVHTVLVQLVIRKDHSSFVQCAGIGHGQHSRQEFDSTESGAITGTSDDNLTHLLSRLKLVVDKSQARLCGSELIAVTREFYKRDELLWTGLFTPHDCAQSAYARLISVRQFDLADALHAVLAAQAEPFPYGRIITGALEGSPAIVVPAEQGKGLDSSYANLCNVTSQGLQQV